MPDRTVNEITDDAYDLTGIKNPKAAEDAKALRFFQNMLSSWSAEGLVVPYYVTENFTLTSGKGVYTIGVDTNSPDLETATGRPLRITDAYFKISNDDYPIDVGMTKSEYARITSKDTETRPRRLYYDPQYPNGKIKFDAECEDAYDFYLISEKPLAEVTAITGTLSLPLEVNEALVFNLAIRLTGGIKSKISDDVRRIAMDSKATLEHINSIEKLSGSVPLDSAIVSRSGCSMDITRGY